MSYKSRIEFIRQNPKAVRKVGLIEYCKELDARGMDKRQIQTQMIIDNVTTSPRMSEEDFRYYKQVKSKIGWIITLIVRN